MDADIAEKTLQHRTPNSSPDDSRGGERLQSRERSGGDPLHGERSQEMVRYKQLRDLLNHQRKFAFHLMSTQEAERTEVAREVQEDLGQLLATLQMNVLLMKNEYRDLDKFVARTEAMDKLIADSIMKVQKISSGLRPVMLDLLGLADAMEWYAQKFQENTGIVCRTTVLLDEKNMHHELSTSVFRIFQEVINNITRHSDATSVQVELTDRKGFLVLLVRDDGRGISKMEKKDFHSFGIAEMRQRAEAFGGKLRIFGVQGRGTALIARIPLNRKEDSHAGQDNNCG